MASSYEEKRDRYNEELRKELELFLKKKYENEEIENNYKRLNFIDEGGFGIVYSAIDQNNGIK